MQRSGKRGKRGGCSDSEFSGSTLWPAPCARDYKDSPGQKSIATPSPNYGATLPVTVYREAAKLWPTPCSRGDNGGGPVGLGGGTRTKKKLDEHVGRDARKKLCSGSLNPDWVEQLMGYPEGWTDIEVDEPSEWAGWPALLGQEQYPFEYPRTTTGCKNRAKRLKALGNAVVPAQVYPFFRAIVEIERRTTNDR